MKERKQIQKEPRFTAFCDLTDPEKEVEFTFRERHFRQDLQFMLEEEELQPPKLHRTDANAFIPFSNLPTTPLAPPQMSWTKEEIEKLQLLPTVAEPIMIAPKEENVIDFTDEENEHQFIHDWQENGYYCCVLFNNKTGKYTHYMMKV